ncbi:PilZ domain-containing protein [Maridesulfovibrio frigidus]|uniref:PilZ domain-containing protein n=1 Tax=Maridesulfovibrio frigidus TaxID=340956 RepID=UPI0004E105B2|nr:PilZ domain-containing protein [Maridesulfovibrio frigidus]
MGKEENNEGLLDRLKSKLDRMLGRKKADSFDVSFTQKAGTPSMRNAFRIDVDNMQVVCKSPRVKCKITDISANGVGFKSSKDFPVGEIIESVMLWSGKPVLKNIKMKVVRRKGSLVGCEFIELDKDQDKIISKIVVAAQKRSIKAAHSGAKHAQDDKEILKTAEKVTKRPSAKDPSKKIKL